MAVNESEIGLPELLAALTEHDTRLREHCKWAEGAIPEDKLREDIEKLNAHYQLLEWWVEFRKLFERPMERIAVRLEDVRRAGSKGQSLTSTDIQTLNGALSEYRNLVGEFTAYLGVTRKERAKRSRHKDQREHPVVGSELDELSQWAEEIEKDWNNRCHKIGEELNYSNVGAAANALSNFWNQVKVAFSNINARIEAHAKEIGAAAGRLQGEAGKVARESRDEQE